MNVKELIDPSLLIRMIDEGYVRCQTHPTEPLAIYNYTERTQYERVWNDATRNCRGLIVHTVTGEIVARPFPKFFNYGEIGDEDKALMTGPIHVTDKLDGSLGITYWEPEAQRWAVATRGSFTSDQARWATERLRSELRAQGVGAIDGPTTQTALVEIIYPANRIVVDYGGAEKLPLLAIIDHETGRNILPDLQAVDGKHINWPDGIVDDFPFDSMMEVLAQPARPNAEGFVIHFLFSDLRVKVKYDEYVRLHRLVTGVTERSIWELLATGKTLDELLLHVPDEFYAWVTEVADRLKAQVARLMFEWGRDMGETLRVLIDQGITFEQVRTTREGRKAFAGIAMTKEYPSALFAALDEKDLVPMAYKLVRPEAVRPFTNMTEDVA